LAADPPAHVRVPVRRTSARWIDVEAHPGVASLARWATAAGDVEGHGTQIAILDEFDVLADLDDFSGDLMP
jgi:hypothetical protein